MNNKPLILKLPSGQYVCDIPIGNEPEEGSPDIEWWIWAACGVGESPTEAYTDWLKDWEKYL